MIKYDNKLLKNLKTKYIGKNLLYYKEIDSTQKEIWRNYENIENGTIILAEHQTSGIGTHGRVWYTENNNIAFSLIIKFNSNYNLSIDTFNGFTLEIAKIIVDIYEKIYNIKIDIKAPNDLIINDKKVGGILTETKIQSNIVKCLVLGIGINTNQINFPSEIKDIATSIKKEFDIEVDNLKIVSEFCNEFESRLEKRIVRKEEKI